MVDYFCNMNYESLMFSLIVVKVCKSKANRQLFCSYVCSTMCCSHHMPGAHKASTTEMTACNYNRRPFGNENQTQVGKKLHFVPNSDCFFVPLILWSERSATCQGYSPSNEWSPPTILLKICLRLQGVIAWVAWYHQGCTFWEDQHTTLQTGNCFRLN